MVMAQNETMIRIPNVSMYGRTNTWKTFQLLNKIEDMSSPGSSGGQSADQYEFERKARNTPDLHIKGVITRNPEQD